MRGKRFIRNTADRALGSVLTTTIRRTARDATNQMTAQRVLVLAPHPDDETLGCGLTILRTLERGGQVRLIVATDGSGARPDIDPQAMAAIRKDELDAATLALGLAPGDVERLDIPDGDLANSIDQLTTILAARISEWRPDVILVTASCDPHPDHAALGEAARSAMIKQEGSLFEYIIWGWTWPTRWLQSALRHTQFGVRGARTFRHAVTVESDHLQASKRNALACHASQLGPSARSVGLPGGTGPLDANFLTWFVRKPEVYFPANAAALDLTSRS